MRLEEIQTRIDAWIGLFEEGYFPPLSNLARLVEEVGELSRALNHRYGSKVPKATEAPTDIEEELGDILFTVAVLANSLEIDLEEVMRQTLNKVIDRDTTRWTMKSEHDVTTAQSMRLPPSKAEGSGSD